jgi:hypothetical protein
MYQSTRRVPPGGVKAGDSWVGTGDRPFPLAANAAPRGAAGALGAVKNGGRLATIMSDPPDAERGIEVTRV